MECHTSILIRWRREKSARDKMRGVMLEARWCHQMTMLLSFHQTFWEEAEKGNGKWHDDGRERICLHKELEVWNVSLSPLWLPPFLPWSILKNISCYSSSATNISSSSILVSPSLPFPVLLLELSAWDCRRRGLLRDVNDGVIHMQKTHPGTEYQWVSQSVIFWSQQKALSAISFRWVALPSFLESPALWGFIPASSSSTKGIQGMEHESE